MKDSNKLPIEVESGNTLAETTELGRREATLEAEEKLYIALAEDGQISPQEIQAFFDRQNAKKGESPAQESNKKAESDLSSGGSSFSPMPPLFGNQGTIQSEGRDLSLNEFDFDKYLISKGIGDNFIRDSGIESVSNALPPVINPPVIPPPPIQIKVAPLALPDHFVVKKYFANAAKETLRHVDFDQFSHGELIDAGKLVHDNLRISVENLKGGEDLGQIVDTKIRTSEIGLMYPWTKGDIEREFLNKVLTVAGDIEDRNGDGISDEISIQTSSPPGTLTGVITFHFTNPIYAFGLDIANADYPSISGSSLNFYDENNLKKSLSLYNLIDPSSRFYDPTLSFGKNSANRISPIEAIEFNFNTFSKIELEVAGPYGIDNLNWLDLESHFVPGRITGNLLSNDFAGTGPITVQSIESLPISNAGETIETAEGGTFTINRFGQFTYIAPNDLKLGNIKESLNYTIVNGAGLTSSSTVTIDVIHNLPTANSNECYIASNDLANNYNLTLIVDVSSSMNALITDKTRLQISREVLSGLIERYDSISEKLNITIIPFASGEGLNGAFAYHATSALDAQNYITDEGSHHIDGLNIQMLNPNTNQPLDRGTHYDSALYHARLSLEAQVTDPQFDDFHHIVYFLSDGQPNENHSATSTARWPVSWGSWKEFIHHTDQAVKGALVDHIQTFAIGIDPEESLRSSLIPIASDATSIVEPTSKRLEDMEDKVLSTIPNCLNAVLLQNDIYGLKSGLVKKISFETEDAAQYISEHHLNNISAVADANGTTVHVSLPADNSLVNFQTPLGGKLAVSATGLYTYAPPVSNDIKYEQFKYTSVDLVTLHEDSANLNIYIYPPSIPVHNLLGASVLDNILSSETLNGVVNMWGQEGKDTFVVDPANRNLKLVHVQDLADNQDNTLRFIHTHDRNHDSLLTLDDVISGFTQEKENGDLYIEMFDTSAKLILQNVGTVPGPQLSDLFQHLEGIATIEVM
ncbi:MAG: hypothetical protein U1E78_11355 [Gammaproteobacteria bacterium]